MNEVLSRKDERKNDESHIDKLKMPKISFSNRLEFSKSLVFKNPKIINRRMITDTCMCTRMSEKK